VFTENEELLHTYSTYLANSL